MNGGYFPPGGGGGSFDPHSPGPIGDVTPSTGTFTQIVGTEFVITGGDLYVGLPGAGAILHPVTSNFLAQRNGTNGQTFSVYATYTDDSNYSRLLIQNTTSTLEFIIDEAGSGVGAVTGYSFDKPIGMVSSGGPEQGTGVPTPVNYYGDPTVMMGAPSGFVDIMVLGVLKSTPYYG